MKTVRFVTQEEWERLMSTIADITAGMASLDAAVAAVVARGAAGTGLSVADQAAVDAAVADLATQAANLEALVTPPAPPAPPAPSPSTSTSTSTGTSSTSGPA